MVPSKPYLLTPTARRHLREAKAWSRRRWGEKATRAYFSGLDAAARRLAADRNAYRPREELSGGTGLRLHPVREHYLVYEPLRQGQIVIVAVLRHDRDIPEILRKGCHAIRRELDALRSELDQSE